MENPSHTLMGQRKPLVATPGQNTTCIERDREGERERKRDREKDGKRSRETDRETERQTDR
jgi:hypothetical protein